MDKQLKTTDVFKKMLQLFNHTFYENIKIYKTFLHLKGNSNDPWWNFIVPKVAPDQLSWEIIGEIFTKEEPTGVSLSFYINRGFYLQYKDNLHKRGYRDLGADTYILLNMQKRFKDPKITVEEVTKKTLPLFISVTEECFPEWDEKTYCKQSFELSRKTYKDYVNKNFLLYKGEEAIAFGSVMFSKTLNIGYLHNLGTIPQYRRKGYFTRMTEYLCNIAYDKGIRELFTLVEENGPSHKGFAKLGFKTEDVFYILNQSFKG